MHESDGAAMLLAYGLAALSGMATGIFLGWLVWA
jgi:hypothetical protein